MDTGLPTVVWRLCLGLGVAVTPAILAGVLGGCAWVRVLVPPLHSWLGFVVFAVGHWVAPRHSWLGFWGVCGCVRAPPVPRRSWLRCVVWVCVLGLGFRLRPVTPGWGVGVGVCLCERYARTPPLLAGVCGVGVCVWVGVSAVPRHSWLGCRGVPLFVCVLRLYPATPDWGVRCGCVCLSPGLGCDPPLLAASLGCMCFCVRAPPVPRHSWLRCAVWVWVLGLGFLLGPRNFLARVLGCVCVCVLARLVPRHSWLGRAVWLCAWAQASAAPRHCWLGCWGMCVFVCALRLYPATPGLVVRCCCLLGLQLRLRPATPGWGVRVCVCLCACSASTLPLLAGVCGEGVCVWAPASATLRHSWLACWGVCVFMCVLRMYPPLLARACGAGVCAGPGLRLRPATPGWGVGVCLCLCAFSACTPPICLGCAVWVGVSGLGFRLRPATPGPGCWGVCVFVCVLRLYPAIPGWVVCVCVCGFVFRVPSALFWFLCRGAWPLACATFLSRRLLVGLSVVWGYAGVAVGGVSPPPSPSGFLFRGAGGEGAVFGPVVLWLRGVRRCLSWSCDSWSPSPLPLLLALRLWLFVFFFGSRWGVANFGRAVPGVLSGGPVGGA